MRKCLVLGSNGFISQPLVSRLVASGKQVKSIDRSFPDSKHRIDNVEYIVGDIFDSELLKRSLKDVDIVYDFISTTMPNSNDISIEKELDLTLRYYNYILYTLYTSGVRNYVFPSSGGAVYGNIETGIMSELNELNPITTYGLGKQLTENIIKYYSNRLGMNCFILRIGNVYGSSSFRSKAQGVIDIFIQNALEKGEICIWGSAENNVRDYVHMLDVADAIVMITEKPLSGTVTYNIASGIGISLKTIVEIIQKKINKPIRIIHKENAFSGINKIVLSIDKMKKEFGWQPSISIEEGIEKTISFKKDLL